MYKLKNKHTGEVITTPYMAEVEEYLNSGDYEMSDKKYPAILKLSNGCIVLADSDGCGTPLSYYKDDYEETFENEYYTDFNSFYLSKNITREYLTNTYGKCESQEHANFICELAKNAGFTFCNDYKNIHDHFWFDGSHMEFDEAKEPKKSKAKLIHLPLPPKKDIYMENKTIAPNEKGSEIWIEKETKPTYTKEMHERGELPPVGSFVYYHNYSGCEVLINKSDADNCIVILINGEYVPVKLEAIKPIPTIEDELADDIADYFDSGKKHCKALVSELLTKYNITPKDS